MNNEEIAQRYLLGENTFEIGRSLGVSHETIRRRLHDFGVIIRSRSLRQRKYDCNHFCFRDITIESMYYAGLLMADGNIAINKQMVQIEVVEKDKELVDGFKQFAEYTGIMERRKRKQRSGKISQMVLLRITSPQMVSDLSRFGVVPKKSYCAVAPEEIVQHPFASFFFRGLFDGDGCVGIRRGKHSYGNKYSTFGGTPALTSAFRKWCETTIGESGGISKRTETFWSVYFCHAATEKLCRSLYGDDRGMRLRRKWNLMMSA